MATSRDIKSSYQDTTFSGSPAAARLVTILRERGDAFVLRHITRFFHRYNTTLEMVGAIPVNPGSHPQRSIQLTLLANCRRDYDARVGEWFAGETEPQLQKIKSHARNVIKAKYMNVRRRLEASATA